jgi:SAM-dependent methyltransferase
MTISAPPEAVKANYPFIRDKIAACFPGPAGLRILDYGCGSGDLVRFLLAAGHDAHGVDVDTFFDDFYQFTDRELLAQKRITVIDARGYGELSGQTFDVVVCNMVVEHVKDKSALFAALSRFLRPDGLLLLFYPVQETIRESHIHQFFIHWLPPGRIRFAWAMVQALLGVPAVREGFSGRAAYIHNWLDNIDRDCFYEWNRSLDAKLAVFFNFSHREEEYFRFRARGKGKAWLAVLLERLIPSAWSRRIFRWYSFAVVQARKAKDAPG